jgi:hypothetical protein
MASDPSCAWTASSSVAWVAITGGTAETGNGTVAFSIAANAGAARSAVINVGGAMFTIAQAAAESPQGGGSCATVTLDSTAKTVGGNEANWTVMVAAPNASCSWAASSDAAWLLLKSTSPTPMPVQGSGTIKVRAVTNDSGASRTGHITVNGVVYTVKQLVG